MCRGRDEETNQSDFARSKIPPEVASDHDTGRSVCCELCGERASLYCQADDAFLCRKCDKQVHGANFLAFRHIRCLLCNTCQSLSKRYLIGNSVEIELPTIMSLGERKWCSSKAQSERFVMMKKWPLLLL